MKAYKMEMIKQLQQWGKTLGFDAVGITNIELADYQDPFDRWMKRHYYGAMNYFPTHGDQRLDPKQILPDVKSVICVRMNYWQINQSGIARYALGRDYHKILKQRLKQLAKLIEQKTHDFHYRICVDTAPMLEKAFAEKAGLGWIGKNTLLLNSENGSWSCLGEIFTNLSLPTPSTIMPKRCGSCTKCLACCPTKALIAPYTLDARRCIAYLTIEYKGSIPTELRPLIGTRIFGCDICQQCCPWNRFSQITLIDDFKIRPHLAGRSLLELFAWSEQEFLQYTEGSAIRRIGYERWQRNLAIALGNSPATPHIIETLEAHYTHASILVREHIDWAIQHLRNRLAEPVK